MSTYPNQHREKDTKRAYEHQVEGGLKGALKYTIYGSLVVTAAHFAWPGFRKQTLALKGFLVSSDNQLLKYEAEFRKAENNARRKAINALAMEGRVASELEIKKWREDHEVKVEPTGMLAPKE